MNNAAKGDWQMASNKTFTLAGTSYYRGELTFRFANGEAKARMAILKRGGHTDVELNELPQAMTKEDAVALMRARGVDAVMPKTRKEGAAPKVRKAKAVPAPKVKTAEELAAEKLADKRARDAARKRAKRAAEKAAREFIDGTAREMGVDAERELG
jgi:hypothetical protein